MIQTTKRENILNEVYTYFIEAVASGEMTREEADEVLAFELAGWEEVWNREDKANNF